MILSFEISKKKTGMPRYKEAILGRKSIHNDKKLTYTEAIERSLYEKLICRKNWTKSRL